MNQLVAYVHNERLTDTMNQLVAYVVNERLTELVEHGGILTQA